MRERLPSILVLACAILVSPVLAVNPTLVPVQTATQEEPCGGYRCKVEMKLPPKQNGWIIQHLRKVPNVYDCNWESAGTANNTTNYWEAWKVTNSQITDGTTTEVLPFDIFSSAAEPRRQGALLAVGYMKFIDGYELKLAPEGPWDYKIIQTGGLPSTETTPPGWSGDAGGVRHDLRISFNCCGSSSVSTAELVIVGKTAVEATGRAPVPSGSQVADILAACPAWTSLQPHDLQGKTSVLRCMKQASKIPIRALRKQLVAFVGANVDSTAQLSKVFLLNRSIFAVPARVPWSEFRSLGAWCGVPSDATGVNVLWPLSVSSAGELAVTGAYQGYFGPPYRALQEFDRFSSMYGMRDW